MEGHQTHNLKAQVRLLLLQTIMYFSTEIILATIILIVLLAGIYFSTIKLVLAGIIFLIFVSCYQETNS